MRAVSRVLEVDGVKAEVEVERYNPLVGRRELLLRLYHLLKPTPSRLQVRFAIAKLYGVDVSRVYVRSIKTEYGAGISKAEIHIYDSVERALAFEPEYIIKRNGGVNPAGQQA